MANTFELIASSTVGSGGAANITFSSIPATFTDLCLKYSLRDSSAVTAQNVVIIINGSTSNVYSSRLLQGNGSSAQSFSQSGTTAPFQYMTGASATSNTFANAEFYFPNYAGSTNKSFSYDGVTENNATSAITALVAGLFSNTAAITSLGVAPEGGATSLVQYSTAYLYGVKNA